jgi:glutamate dehydrogenase
MGKQPGALGLKVYRFGEPLVLSDALPLLEHMGVRVIAESSWRILRQGDAGPIAMHDFKLQAPLTGEIESETLARLFEDAFARVLRSEVESDDFNRLVLLAGLAAEEVVVLRAYAKYLKQIGFAQSQATIAATLSAHPRMARMLVGLFKLRFDPQRADAQAATSQVNAIEKALEKVSNISEDLVLRQLLALIQATLRTNFWRTGRGHSGAPGPRRHFLSFKLDCARVPGLPPPRPLYEIFVYSPSLRRHPPARRQGSHAAACAGRTGPTTSAPRCWACQGPDGQEHGDRAGGFQGRIRVEEGTCGHRPRSLHEGRHSLLPGLPARPAGPHDNLIAGKVVPPPQVVRFDSGDPYLVVAADKGTATFSDYANQISQEYGHWLGDAFASGGSVGYDHKAMGITARGAWESVKRHFREMGLDTQATDFTVVGIGDMSGDVFGNGMLLSPHIRLVAAFDHRHIFIDPQPDAAAAFRRAQAAVRAAALILGRLRHRLISEGGGVWARSEKSIPYSPQARAALGITAERMTATELVSAILKAPADLLYNGGIGTYVKASTESHADVGDRANDALRVNGSELRCKVVGEGGNLGMTQRGPHRGRLGGRAPVHRRHRQLGRRRHLGPRSQHQDPAGTGRGRRQAHRGQRNALLPTMTDDVAALVLRDNCFQTQALSIGRYLAPGLIDEQARFMRFLKRRAPGSRPRVPADRRRDRRAQGARPGPDDT